MDPRAYLSSPALSVMALRGTPVIRFYTGADPVVGDVIPGELWGRTDLAEPSKIRYYDDTGAVKTKASGLAALNIGGKVDATYLGDGVGATTKFLRDDGIYAVPTGGSGLGHAEIMARGVFSGPF